MPGYAFATGMEFAAPAVDVLCAQGDPPALLIGYPPGLQHRSGYAPLAEASARHGIPLLETADINDGQALACVSRLGLDLFVIAGWSQLIREPLLSACPLGAIGLHPTRLPEGRGRAPLPWTIIKGVTTSAVSLFFLKPGVDDGDIIDQAEFTVSRRDDVASVYRKVTEINIALLANHIPAALRGEITAVPQAPGGSLWPRRRPEDGVIDWNQPAAAVYDWIRALGTPYPGAFTSHHGRRLWIHSADLLDAGLRGADPRDAHLPGADPGDAHPHGTNPHGTEPHGAEPRDADPNHADPNDAHLRHADRHGAHPHGAHPHDADPRDTDLPGADLRRADLHDAHLLGVNLRNAHPRDAESRDAHPRNAEPRGDDAHDADLLNAGLRDAHPGGAEPRGAHPHDAHPGGADSHGADLLDATRLSPDPAPTGPPASADRAGTDHVLTAASGAAASESAASESDRGGSGPAPSCSPSRSGARFPTGRAETSESGQIRPDVHPAVSVGHPIGSAGVAGGLSAAQAVWAGQVVGPVWSTSIGGVVVACASGTVIIREVQWEDGPRQDALALFESGELAVGERLGVT